MMLYYAGFTLTTKNTQLVKVNIYTFVVVFVFCGIVCENGVLANIVIKTFRATKGNCKTTGI